MKIEDITKRYGLNAGLTDDYRLARDSRQFIVLERHTVDPAKAPNFDPKTDSRELRETWREVGYFGISTAGLSAAIEYAAMRSIGGKLALKELLAEIRRLSDDIRRIIPVELKD